MLVRKLTTNFSCSGGSLGWGSEGTQGRGEIVRTTLTSVVDEVQEEKGRGENAWKWEFVKVTPFQLLAKLLPLESAGRGALVPHNSSRIVSELGIWHQEEKIGRDRDLLTNRRRSEHIGRAAGTTAQHTPPQWYVVHLHLVGGGEDSIRR